MACESIFKSTIRSFFKSFAVIIGIAIALIVIAVVIGFITPQSPFSEKTTIFVDVDADGNRELLASSAPVILKVNIQGEIGSRGLTSSHVKAQLADSRTGMFKGDRVKALLLYINSPGGDAIDSFTIYKELLDYKKKYQVPIYGFVDGFCASGAMMIACAADKVYSNPIGIIGSVGVRIGPNFNVAQMMDKFGIKQKTITQGKDKDMLNPFRPWKPNEDQSIENIVSHDYSLFIDIVSQARPRLTKEKLINEYGAQVFDPSKAETLGYIDHGQSNYKDMLTDLVKQAGIAENTRYQVVELRVQQPLLVGLTEGKSPFLSGVLNHQLQFNDDFLLHRSLYLYSPALDSFEE
ncbi:MAG: S49 family peptidase [Chlamydiota bacterium]